MAAPNQDKVLIGAALVVALASAGVFGWMTLRHTGPAGGVPAVELTSAPYEAKAPDAPPIKTETWAPPVAQSRGRDWIYDTFTPPEIFYNTRSKQFSVKPPSSLIDEDQQEVFGLELVAVKPEPFRLQMIGYSGSAGNWRGTFTSIQNGETILAAEGRRLDKLALTIKRLDVSTQTVRIGESMPVRQTVASAVVLDEKSGREITLTNRERVFTGTVFAFVAAPGSTATREVRTGDTFQIGDASFRVEKIQTSPPTVEVVKESPRSRSPIAACSRRAMPTPSPVSASPVPETRIFLFSPPLSSPNFCNENSPPFHVTVRRACRRPAGRGPRGTAGVCAKPD